MINGVSGVDVIVGFPATRTGMVFAAGENGFMCEMDFEIGGLSKAFAVSGTTFMGWCGGCVEGNATELDYGIEKANRNIYINWCCAAVGAETKQNAPKWDVYLIFSAYAWIEAQICARTLL